MTPDLCDIKRIFIMIPRLFLCHNLDIHSPARIFTLYDRLIQITAMALPVFCDQRPGLFVRQVFNPLLGNKMEFAPESLIVFIVKTKGMFSIEIHMTERRGNSAVRHHNSRLMERLRQQRPEIPVVLRRAHAGLRIALYRTVQIREIMDITEEEGWCIISDQIPVSFFCIKLDRHAADIALCVSRAPFPRYR